MCNNKNDCLNYILHIIGTDTICGQTNDIALEWVERLVNNLTKLKYLFHLLNFSRHNCVIISAIMYLYEVVLLFGVSFEYNRIPCYIAVILLLPR